MDITFSLSCLNYEAPELLERRASKPADDSLATQLLKCQHKEAESLTIAFYRCKKISELI